MGRSLERKLATADLAGSERRALRRLLQLPTAEVRRRTGLDWRAIRRLRGRLGVAPPRAGGAWQPAESALLGTAPDHAVARRLGRSVTAVAVRRRQLGIPAVPGGEARRPAGRLPRPPRPPRIALRRAPARARVAWEPAMSGLLGKASDRELARRAGVHVETVAAERRRRGIAAMQPQQPPLAWTPASIARLGTASDGEVAAELGVARWQVKYRRQLLGIPPFAPPPHEPIGAYVWQPEDLARLGTMSDQRLAARLGLSPGAVRAQRRRRRIPAFRPAAPRRVWSEEMAALLGRMPDPEVARALGLPLAAVKKRRKRLGIPGPVDRGEVLGAASVGLEELLALSNTEVRRRTGLSWQTIRRLRAQLGVAPPAGGRPWQPAELALLGTAPDREVARRLGRSVEAVAARRRRRGRGRGR